MSASALPDVTAGPGYPFFVHPNPQTTILPSLREHLPSAITQEYLTRNARLPYVVFATYAPTASPPRNGTWSTAVLDPTCRNETGLWFWSSVESALIDTSNVNFEIPLEHGSFLQTALTHLDKILFHIARSYSEIDSLIIGNLHSAFTPFMNSQPSTTRVSENWAKMIYTPEALPPPNSTLSEDEYRFGQIEDRHLDEVLSTSSVARGRATVLASPNTAIFSRATDEPLAWCFTSREGSVSTLYVRPEARGRGLGKAAMRAELVRAFERDGRPFGSVEVSLTNAASLGLSESMGARKRWEVVWATVNLEALRRTAAASAL